VGRSGGGFPEAGGESAPPHAVPATTSRAAAKRRLTDSEGLGALVARILLQVRIGDEHVGGHRIEITPRGQIRATRRVALPGPVIAAHELLEPDQVGSA